MKKIRKLTHPEILLSKPSPEEVHKKKRTPFYVVLDNIRSLHNVGSIFRTSDAVLAQKLYLCGITGRPPRKEIDKVALGACDLVPWEYVENTEDALMRLKNDGVKICALEITDQSRTFWEMKYDFPVALLLGNEVDGISEGVMGLVDFAVSLPMLGRANSLNVANAYTVMAYEFLKQYSDFSS